MYSPLYKQYGIHIQKQDGNLKIAIGDSLKHILNQIQIHPQKWAAKLFLDRKFKSWAYAITSKMHFFILIIYINTKPGKTFVIRTECKAYYPTIHVQMYALKIAVKHHHRSKMKILCSLYM